MASLVLPTTLLMSWVFISLASGVERRKLVWSDEFNDEELDRTKWVILHGDGCNTSLGCGWGRGQLDVSLPSNARLQDGHLVITAGLFGNGSLSPSDPPTTTSARLSTFGSADFLHGRVEVRAKMPSGGWGGWGGIWLIPSKQTLEEQASCARVDVAEVSDFTANSAIASLHFGGIESGCKSSEEWPEDGGGCIFSLSGTSDALSESFHVYAVEWENGEFRWFVDEWHYCTKRRWFSDADPFPAPFNASFHVEMALAVGGGRGNIRVDDVDLGALPQELFVDYVRISQGASGSMQVSPADFSSSESRSGSRTSRMSSVVLVALALAACVAGPYMAVTGPSIFEDVEVSHSEFKVHNERAFRCCASRLLLSRPRANIRMMGIEIGAFKASNVIHILSKSDVVALGACIPFGLFSGYLAVRHRTVARWNTVAGLAVPSLLLLIDLGTISDIGSRYVGWAIFFVLTVTFAVLTCPPEHHIIAFSFATAATGGCVLKLGLGHLLGAPGEIFKILDDPLGDRCYVSRTCRSLTWVSATMFLVGLCVQRWFVRLSSKLEKDIDHERDDNAMFTPPREVSSPLSMVKSNSCQRDLVTRPTEGFMPAEPTGHTEPLVRQQGRQTFPRDAFAAETARWGGVLTTVSRSYQRVLEALRAAPGSASPIENATGFPTPVPIPLAGRHRNTTVSNQGDTIELVVRSPMKVVRSNPISRGGAVELHNSHGGGPRAKSQRRTGLSESGKEPTSSGPNTRRPSTPGEKQQSSLTSSRSGSFVENARIVSGSQGGSFRGRLAQVFSDKWGAWGDIDGENMLAVPSGRCARDFDHEALRLSPYDPYPCSPRASSSGSSSSSTQPIYEAWTSQKSDKHSPSSEAADLSIRVPPVHISKRREASIVGNGSGVVPAESSLASAASRLSPRLGPMAASEDLEKRRRGPVADAGSCVSICEGQSSAGRRALGDEPNHGSLPDTSQRDDTCIQRVEPRRGSKRHDAVQPTSTSGEAPGNRSPESPCGEKKSARSTGGIRGMHVEGRPEGQGAVGISRSTHSPLPSQRSRRRDEMKSGVRVTSRDEAYGSNGDLGEILDEDGVTRSVSRRRESSRRSSGKPKLKDVDLL